MFKFRDKLWKRIDSKNINPPDNEEITSFITRIVTSFPDKKYNQQINIHLESDYDNYTSMYIFLEEIESDEEYESEKIKAEKVYNKRQETIRKKLEEIKTKKESLKKDPEYKIYEQLKKKFKDAA